MGNLVNEPRLVKTTKRHYCRYCAAAIPKGTKGVLVESGFYDDEAFREWACPECVPYHGDFWEWVGYECTDILGAFDDFMREEHPDDYSRYKSRQGRR